MKFTAIKENLTDALNIIQKAISSKNTMTLLGGIYLKAENDHLQLISTDLEWRIELSIPVEVIEAGDTVVNGRSFIDFVRRLPDTAIHFENVSRDGIDHMTITYGDAAASMNGWPGREYPTLPANKEEKFYHMSNKIFQQAVGLTAFTVNPDEIRPVFTGLLLQIRGHRFKLVGTDSFRLGFFEAAVDNKNNEDIDVIIPVKTLLEVSRLDLSDDINFCITENKIIFYLDDVTIYSNLIRGDYPPYERVIPSSYESFFKIERRELMSSIERAQLFSREKDGTSVVRWVLEGNVLHIYTESESGNVKEHLKVYQEGEDVDIAFNTKFILDALKAMKFEELEITLNGAMGPCIFKPQTNDEYLYLILPLRR